MIQIVDNFLEDDDFTNVINFCRSSSYLFGERDDVDIPPTGAVSIIKPNDFFYSFLENKIRNNFIEVKKLNISRMYINCFSPNENPYFHTDGEYGLTFLYYANQDWILDDGGETQFLIEDNIHGILPLPNRLIYFDSSLLHKATSFRNKHRFSIAIKFS